MQKAKAQPNDFNLDELERPDAKVEPFRVTVDGEQYVFNDAAEIDYRDLLDVYEQINAGRMDHALAGLLAAEDRDGFFKHKIPTWKLEKLFSAYTAYYGLPSSPGESFASRRR